MTNINFYHIFCISLIGNGIIIIPQGKRLASKWCHSINNAKIVLETKHCLHKINKTPLNIHKYINKTCLKQNQTKLKKTLSVHYIYNTNCKKNTTIREDYIEMDDFQSTQMDNSLFPRRTYLIAYSQADLGKGFQQRIWES